jgi:hypothetical protein
MSSDHHLIFEPGCECNWYLNESNDTYEGEYRPECPVHGEKS